MNNEIGCSNCPYSKPNSVKECFYANTSVAKDCKAYINKPKSCSKCKYHYDYSIEDEPCKSCVAYSNYEDMRGDV